MCVGGGLSLRHPGVLGAGAGLLLPWHSGSPSIKHFTRVSSWHKGKNNFSLENETREKRTHMLWAHVPTGQEQSGNWRPRFHSGAWFLLLFPPRGAPRSSQLCDRHLPFLLKQVRGSFYHQGSTTHPSHRPALNIDRGRASLSCWGFTGGRDGPKTTNTRPTPRAGETGDFQLGGF